MADALQKWMTLVVLQQKQQYCSRHIQMVSQDLNNVKKQHCQQPCWLAPCWQLHSDVEQQHAMSQSCGVAIDSTILLSSADAHSEIPDLPPQMTDTKLQISTMLGIAFMSKNFFGQGRGCGRPCKNFPLI